MVKKQRSNTNRNATRTMEQTNISTLQSRIKSECTQRGYAPPLNQKVSFRSLPISEATLRGLEEGDGKQNQNGNKKRNQQQRGGGNNNNNNNNNRKKNTSNFSSKKQFWTMTDIQNACIPHALMGRDILGAARTGR